MNPSGLPVETCTIITTDANSLVGEMHNRVPVILAPGNHAAWLNANNPNAQELLRPLPSELLITYPVSQRVSNLKNDDAGCIAPIAT